MKMNTKTRYGLRFMVYLGTKHKQGPVQLREVAEKELISDKYLEAIVASLKSARLIESVRGHRGGYYLACSPQDITVFDIVRIFEGPMTLIDCFSGKKRCELEKTCVTVDVWQELSRKIKEYLSSITLQYLVEEKIKKNKIAMAK